MALAYVKIMDQFPGADARKPVKITGCVAGAANADTEIAHTRDYTPSVAIPVLDGTTGGAAESPLGAVVEVVSIDATNVTVKCATASVPFHLIVF